MIHIQTIPIWNGFLNALSESTKIDKHAQISDTQKKFGISRKFTNSQLKSIRTNVEKSLF